MTVQPARAVIMLFAALVLLAFVLPAQTRAQRRDYLTEEEIELVRDAQEIDKRVAVLISAIDRRFAVLRGEVWKPSKKDADKWGDLPTARRADLVSDISKILQKAIDDIDDLAARRAIDDKVLGTERKDELDDETSRIIKSNKKSFAGALNDLADASRRYLPLLESMAGNPATSVEKEERGAIYSSIESCNLIIEAAGQVPRPASGKKQKE